MRKGEAMALQWSDIDFKNRVIQVEQTIDYDEIDSNDPFGDTKTESSERAFLITSSFAFELKAHRVRQNQYKDRFGGLYKSELDLVLCRQDGSPLRKSTLFNAFRRILNKVGLPNMRIHSLRHTHSVLMIESGVIIKDLSERLGHASEHITDEIDAHTSKIIQMDSIEKFEKHTDKILNRRSRSGQNDGKSSGA